MLLQGANAPRLAARLRVVPCPAQFVSVPSPPFVHELSDPLGNFPANRFARADLYDRTKLPVLNMEVGRVVPDP